MTTIIIFTRIDYQTLNYFQSLFPQLDIGADSQEDFTFLEFKINDSLPRILFINDERECEIENLQLSTTDDNYVYYHTSSRYYNHHKDFIQKELPECHEYFRENQENYPGDHHNGDGYHYAFLLKAAEAFSQGKIDDFNREIDNLTT